VIAVGEDALLDALKQHTEQGLYVISEAEMWLRPVGRHMLKGVIPYIRFTLQSTGAWAQKKSHRHSVFQAALDQMCSAAT